MITQYHLRGKGHSGRAVRVKSLSPGETEDNLTAAAKLCGGDGTILEIKKAEWRTGIKSFIVQYTDPCEDPLAADVKWKKPSSGQFDDAGEYFTSKDWQVLEAIYRELHEVSVDELNAITGKALPVSEV